MGSGIGFNTETGNINIFPNPAESTIVFKISKYELYSADLVIVNNLGLTVYQQDDITGNKFSINLTGLHGLFFYRIIDQKMISKGKFIIK